MPGLPCANHPNETTYVRCGRCDKPICVRCMVDTPVGKKCRECAANRTHLSQSSARQVTLALLAALAVALPAGAVLHQVPLLVLPAFAYGYVVGLAGLWGGQRSRSLAVQVATGAAALVGALVGAGVVMLPGEGGPGSGGLAWQPNLGLIPMLNTGLGTFAAVSRVRFW